MRTTIEIRDEHRAALLELAARRGKKGFSEIVAEAIEEYLESPHERERRHHAALALEGTLSPMAAARLRRATRAIRRRWR